MFKKIKSVYDVLKSMGLESTPESKAYIRYLLRSYEEMPVDEESKKRNTLGFVFAQKWWPVIVLNELKNGWAETRSADGCQGPSLIGHWAHCTADLTPCLPDEVYRMFGLDPNSRKDESQFVDSDDFESRLQEMIDSSSIQS